MAADRSRLAAALAYKQAEDERRRRMMESVPVPGAEMPTPAPTQNFRRDLENLSIGIGEGLTRQLEGVKGIVTDPIGAAKGAYEGVKAVVRDPAIIADALRYTAEKARSGPLGAGEVIGEMIGPRKGGPMMQELDVYHGTPHRFPATEANPLGEFDASKIGTGEGAQVFGHGIYMAEKPAVAQDYQFMLSKIDPNKATYQGKPVEKWYEMAQAEQDRAHRLRDQKAIDRANAKLAFWENVMTRRHPEDAKRVANDPDDGWPELANYANSLDMNKFGGISEAGSLYKADLPDEMVGRMLDWYKPLSEQPKAVREALKKSGLTSYVDEMEQSYFSQLSPAARAVAQKMINGPDEMIVVSGKGLKNNKVAEKNWDELERLAPGIDHNRVHDIRDWYQSKSGADLYSEMSRNGVQDASERLRQMGIPGISYLDAGSRGATGAQTRNFVVFPGEEKKVRILERK
jgi:hypothetical protein